MDVFTFVSEQWMLVSLLLVLIYVFAISERVKSGKPISVHEVTRMLNADEAVLVDVRDGKDLSAGSIANALHIPHNKLAERAVELDKYKGQKVLIVVDKMGQHAGAAGRNLRQKGHQVVRLGGGMAEWQNQKLPMVKG